MRRKIVALWLCLVLTVLVVGCTRVEPDPTEAKVAVDPGVKHQEIGGFGGALAFYENWVTGSQEKEKIYDLLFVDLGLDILRLRNVYDYPVDDPDPMRHGVEFYHAAKTRNPGIKVLLSSWSPPDYLKKDGIMRGGTLKKDGGAFMYPKYAEYWRASLVAYADREVVPDYISIQNEPDFVTDGWETCRFDAQESSAYPGYGKALKEVADLLDAEYPDPPLIIGPECAGISGGRVQSYAKEMDLSQVHALAYHLYNGGDQDNPDSYLSNLRAIASAYPNVRIWQTEFDWPTPFKNAWLIHNCLVEGNVSAYFYWALVWPGEKGLVEISNPWQSDYYSPTDYFYYFQHYAKHIDSGYRRVGAVSDSGKIKVSAFLSPNGEKLTLVLINTGGARCEVTLGISGFPVDKTEIYRTTDGTQEKFAAVGSLGSGNMLVLNPRSVATVVVTAGPEQDEEGD
jgi:glucuronoarabinoxylan endo-1,4-beta-xylanase